MLDHIRILKTLEGTDPRLLRRDRGCQWTYSRAQQYFPFCHPRKFVVHISQGMACWVSSANKKTFIHRISPWVLWPFPALSAATSAIVIKRYSGFYGPPPTGVSSLSTTCFGSCWLPFSLVLSAFSWRISSINCSWECCTDCSTSMKKLVFISRNSLLLLWPSPRTINTFCLIGLVRRGWPWLYLWWYGAHVLHRLRS